MVASAKCIKTNNITISDMSIDSTMTNQYASYAGLFAGRIIKSWTSGINGELTISNSHLEANSAYIGGAVGNLVGSIPCTITVGGTEQSSASDTSTTSTLVSDGSTITGSTNSYIGGIVGYWNRATDCSYALANYADVTASTIKAIGGLFGWINATSSVALSSTGATGSTFSSSIKSSSFTTAT